MILLLNRAYIDTITTYGAYTTPKYHEVHIDPDHNAVVRIAGLLADGVEPLGGGGRFERAEYDKIITELGKCLQLFAWLPLQNVFQSQRVKM